MPSRESAARLHRPSTLTLSWQGLLKLYTYTQTPSVPHEPEPRTTSLTQHGQQSLQRDASL